MRASFLFLWGEGMATKNGWRKSINESSNGKVSLQKYVMEDIFPTLDESFFIFNSLGTTNPNKGGHGRKQAEELRNQANNALNRESLTGREDADSKTTLENALEFLRIAAETEANREKTFFKDIFFHSTIAETTQGQAILKCFSGDVIDYNQFTRIMTELDVGVQKERQMREELIKEITTFQEVLQETLKKYPYLQKLYDKGNISAVISKMYSDENISFASRRFVSSELAGLKRTSAFTHALAGYDRAENSELIKLITQNFMTLKSKGVVSRKLSATNDKYGKALVFELTSELIAMAKRKLSKNNNDNPLVNELITTATEIFTNMIQTLQKTGSLNKEGQEFVAYANRLLKNIDSLTEEQAAMFGVRKNITIGKSGLLLLDKDTRQILEKYANSKCFNYGEEFKDQKFQSAKVRKDYQARLKTFVAKTLNKNVEELSTEEFAEEVSKIVYKSKSPTFTLSAHTEHGAILSEKNIFRQIGLHFGGSVVGLLNGKADTTGLIPIGEARAFLDGYGEYADEILNEVTKGMNETYEVAYKQALDEARKQAAETFEGNKDSYFKTDNAYSFLADATANDKSFEAGLRIFKEKLGARGKELPEEKILKYFKDLVFVETSVKRYEYYVDEKGFKGGSIGASIYEQVQNICNAATQAGLAVPDPQWLVFAAINSGEGLIGRHLAPHLSQYFAIFASMLMFRSSSDLLQQVRQQMQNVSSTNSGRKSIRLYTLQGRFVLGSSVLYQTYKVLEPIVKQIQQQGKIHGYNQVTIVNNAGQDINGSQPRPWEGPKEFSNFSAQHIGDVSINLQLLIGFLGLLENLEKAAKSI